VPADGIPTSEPCSELQVLLPEAGKDYGGSKIEILTMTKMYVLCGFNNDDDLEIEMIVPSQKNMLSFVQTIRTPKLQKIAMWKKLSSFQNIYTNLSL
jgi:hypothetical protein